MTLGGTKVFGAVVGVAWLVFAVDCALLVAGRGVGIPLRRGQVSPEASLPEGLPVEAFGLNARRTPKGVQYWNAALGWRRQPVTVSPRNPLRWVCGALSPCFGVLSPAKDGTLAYVDALRVGHVLLVAAGLVNTFQILMATPDGVEPLFGAYALLSAGLTLAGLVFFGLRALSRGRQRLLDGAFSGAVPFL